MIRVALPFATLMLLGACMQKERPEPVASAPVVPGVQCNAGPAEKLIGRASNVQALAEARRLSGARIVRTIRPDMMVTMEFLPDRLNLHLSTDGKIASVRCG